MYCLSMVIYYSGIDNNRDIYDYVSLMGGNGVEEHVLGTMCESEHSNDKVGLTRNDLG